jgi:hypothetical protein
MIMGEYGTVIGWKEPITWQCRQGTYRNANFSANHSVKIPHDHQIMEFRQMIVWSTVVNYCNPFHTKLLTVSHPCGLTAGAGVE